MSDDWCLCEVASADVMSEAVVDGEEVEEADELEKQADALPPPRGARLLGQLPWDAAF